MEFGKPGTGSSLMLRIAQSIATGLALLFLLLNPPFYLFTITRGLALATFGQTLWSLIMLVYDLFSLKQEGNLLSRTTLTVFVLGDFTIGGLLLAATSSAAATIIYLMHDTNLCKHIEDKCDRFLIAVVFAAFGWLLSSISALVMFVHCARAN